MTEIIIIKLFVQRKIMSLKAILSAYTRTYTEAPAHTNILTTRLKTGSKRGLDVDDDSSTEQKIWQVCSFGKRNVFRLHLTESREGFSRRGRGRSFHVDGPKTDLANSPEPLKRTKG